MKASSLNFPDALMVQGLYQVKPPLPFSPGHEIAGVVSRLGEGVLGVAGGDAVIGTPGVGTAHFPANGDSDYDYDESRVVWN